MIFSRVIGLIRSRRKMKTNSFALKSTNVIPNEGRAALTRERQINKWSRCRSQAARGMINRMVRKTSTNGFVVIGR